MRKSSNAKKQGLMIPMPIPVEPFERIGMDLTGPLPKTKARNEYVLVITDYLTKYVVTHPMSAIDAPTILEVVKERIFYEFGVPRVIVTDNGSNLCAEFVEGTYQQFGIIHRTSTYYRPQTNGQTERYNRVLGDQLAIFCNHKKNTWDRYLRQLTFAYNTTVHSAHGKTPHYLLFGKTPRSALDVMIELPELEGIGPEKDNQVSELDKIQAARWLAKQLIQEAQWCAKLKFDEKHDAPKYKLGDLVLCIKPPKDEGHNKCGMPWKGPWRIIKIITDVNYQIRLEEEPHEEIITHIAKLKPFHSRLVQDSREAGSDVDSECEEPIDSVENTQRAMIGHLAWTELTVCKVSVSLAKQSVRGCGQQQILSIALQRVNREITAEARNSLWPIERRNLPSYSANFYREPKAIDYKCGYNHPNRVREFQRSAEMSLYTIERRLMVIQMALGSLRERIVENDYAVEAIQQAVIRLERRLAYINAIEPQGFEAQPPSGESTQEEAQPGADRPIRQPMLRGPLPMPDNVGDLVQPWLITRPGTVWRDVTLATDQRTSVRQENDGLIRVSAIYMGDIVDVLVEPNISTNELYRQVRNALSIDENSVFSLMRVQYQVIPESTQSLAEFGIDHRPTLVHATQRAFLRGDLLVYQNLGTGPNLDRDNPAEGPAGPL